MANYCNYEIHARGNKKACYLLFAAQPSADYKDITFAEGTDDDFIIHYEGCCKWSLDAYCKEKINEDNIPNIDELTLEYCMDEENGLDIWYYTMKLKSEFLGLEIVARSWSTESSFDNVEHFKNGVEIGIETLFDYYDYWMSDDDEEDDDDENLVEEFEKENQDYDMPGYTHYEFPF